MSTLRITVRSVVTVIKDTPAPGPSTEINQVLRSQASISAAVNVSVSIVDVRTFVQKQLRDGAFAVASGRNERRPQIFIPRLDALAPRTRGSDLAVIRSALFRACRSIGFVSNDFTRVSSPA